MAKRVSPDVVRRPRAGTAPGPYLVRRGEVFFFQIRPPQGLVPGRNLPPLRVRLGIRSRGQARHEAAFLARLARAAFVAWMERGMTDFRDVNIGFPLGETYEELNPSRSGIVLCKQQIDLRFQPCPVGSKKWNGDDQPGPPTAR